MAFIKNYKEQALENNKYAVDLQKNADDSYFNCRIFILYAVIYGRYDDFNKFICYVHQAREMTERIGAKERLLPSFVFLGHFSGLQSYKKILTLIFVI